MSPTPRRTRVLVVDDSVVARRLLTEVLGEDADIEVVGAAATGQIALVKLQQVRPDVIVLDVEMPEMSGLELLPLLRKANAEARIIMFSSLTARGAAATLDALALGASDYVTKPSGTSGLGEARTRIKQELCSKIKALHRRGLSHSIEISALAAPPRSRVVAPVPVRRPSIVPGRVDVVAIGSSTGGPNALAEVVAAFDQHFPSPVLIVQHMPPVFTRLLAERLAIRAGCPVTEAQDGETIEPGHVYVAPGDYHLTVAREAGRVMVRLNQASPENFCRPAVDTMFRSLVPVYGGAILAAVLTGMGQDGFRACQDIKAAGGFIIAQDKASSVVWGMPGHVAQGGLADEILPINQIGQRLAAVVAAGRGASRGKAAARGRETNGH